MPHDPGATPLRVRLTEGLGLNFGSLDCGSNVYASQSEALCQRRQAVKERIEGIRVHLAVTRYGEFEVLSELADTRAKNHREANEVVRQSVERYSPNRFFNDL